MRWAVLALTFAHCGGAGAADEAARIAQAGRSSYEQAAGVFEHACTERYTKATTAEEVHALDARCLPARDALEAHRLAVQTLEAAIAAGRDGDVLRDAEGHMARTGDAVSESLGGVCAGR